MQNLPPDVLKALQAGGKDLPPELVRALGASGAPTGPRAPALPPRPADVPEFWPQDIPTPPGGKLQTQIALDTRASLVYQAAKPTRETVEHYSTSMPQLGWKQQENVTTDEGTRLTYTKGERTATVSVARPRDGESMIFLTVIVKAPPAGASPPGAPPPGAPPPGAPPPGAPVPAPPGR